MSSLLFKAYTRSYFKHAHSRYSSFLIVDRLPRGFVLKDNMKSGQFNGKPGVLIDFHSEPLGLHNYQCRGWPILKLGEQIGPQDQYTLVRKLGWGATCSTWLAQNKEDRNFVAIKVLTEYSTWCEQNGAKKEVQAMTKLNQDNSSSHCVTLFSSFTIPSKGPDVTKSHLCLVSPFYGGDVHSIVSQSKTLSLPLKLAKHILLHVLRGISHAHKNNIVHCDIKHSNIFFDNPMSNEAIEEWLKADPSRLHPPEHSPDMMVQAAVSQPLPDTPLHILMKRKFLLADFGFARIVEDHTSFPTTGPPFLPLSRQPPETLLQIPGNEKIDIWNFGCLVYELCMGEHLFGPGRREEYKILTDKEWTLYTMMAVSGETFEPHMLREGKDSALYFKPDGTFIKDVPAPEYYPLEEHMDGTATVRKSLSRKKSGTFFTQGLVWHKYSRIVDAANFIRRCLRLNPEKRPSAEELLQDPWFRHVN